MAFWAATNDQVKQAVAGKTQFVSEDDLYQESDAFFGPTASQIKAAFPDHYGWLKLTDKPWQAGAENFHGIGVNNTIWVLHPKAPHRGVWILNATSEEAAKNAANVSSPTQWGYFMQASGDLPTAKELRDSGMIWQKGFMEAFYKDYPDQDDRPKTPKPKPEVPITTLEFTATLNGNRVLVTDVLQKAGPGDCVLADGAELGFGDAPEDGYGLAGPPNVGKWTSFVGKRSPASFGLDPDKGVLMWDGEKGIPISGADLKDIFGASWRTTVYG